MPAAIDYQTELDFYVRHLKEAVLPFWLRNGIDRDCGGYFTCFSNDGGRLVSTDKFTWSQGRMVWILSTLSAMEIFNGAERAEFLALARSGAEFLRRHSRLDNGNCAFVLSRDGAPKIPGGETVCDTSILADCFVILGTAKLAAAAQDREWMDWSYALYRHTMGRFARGDCPTQPYPGIAGYRGHPMTLLNVAEETAWALAAFGREEAQKVSAEADGYADEILRRFVSPGRVLRERIRDDGSFDDDSLLGREINPGHTIECLWFLLHQALGAPAGDAFPCGEALKPGAAAVVRESAEILKNTFRAGWDGERGGLLLFADKDGGPPKGSAAGFEREVMVRKIRNDWGNKLWWTHSEALYTPLLLYGLTGDAEILGIYRQVKDYAFSTFPNPDRAVGEWIQIRDRDGRPEDKVVALPVKDPFHIARNLILVIRLLESRIRAQV